MWIFWTRSLANNLWLCASPPTTLAVCHTPLIHLCILYCNLSSKPMLQMHFQEPRDPAARHTDFQVRKGVLDEKIKIKVKKVLLPYAPRSWDSHVWFGIDFSWCNPSIYPHLGFLLDCNTTVPPLLGSSQVLLNIEPKASSDLFLLFFSGGRGLEFTLTAYLEYILP